MLEEKTNSELYKQYWEAGQEIDKRGGSVDSYAAPHVWNLVAKILREHYESGPIWDDAPVEIQISQQKRKIEELALAFAKRFSEDAGFNPLAFLDKCSPDPELYPFSEMWEEDER